jgi:glycosyltransferase A (GT-A) superfamily protein (DUF2064 family)
VSGGTRTATGLATAFVGDVCVFVKPPVAGQVKTRLASTLGQTAAAELAPEADLRRLADLLARGAVRAPVTADVFNRLGLAWQEGATEAPGAGEG